MTANGLSSATERDRLSCAVSVNDIGLAFPDSPDSMTQHGADDNFIYPCSVGGLIGFSQHEKKKQTLRPLHQGLAT